MVVTSRVARTQQEFALVPTGVAMRSLLDGSGSPAGRAPIQCDYCISDQNVQDFAASGPTAGTLQAPRQPPSPPSSCGCRGRRRSLDHLEAAVVAVDRLAAVVVVEEVVVGKGLRCQMDLLAQTTC